MYVPSTKHDRFFTFQGSKYRSRDEAQPFFRRLKARNPYHAVLFGWYVLPVEGLALPE